LEGHASLLESLKNNIATFECALCNTIKHQSQFTKDQHVYGRYRVCNECKRASEVKRVQTDTKLDLHTPIPSEPSRSSITSFTERGIAGGSVPIRNDSIDRVPWDESLGTLSWRSYVEKDLPQGLPLSNAEIYVSLADLLPNPLSKKIPIDVYPTNKEIRKHINRRRKERNAPSVKKSELNSKLHHLYEKRVLIYKEHKTGKVWNFNDAL